MDRMGPIEIFPGHDPNYVGMAGILGITGTSNGGCVLPGIAMGDFSSGGQAVIGSLCALLAREKTGRGQYIDVAILDSLISWTVFVMVCSFLPLENNLKQGEDLLMSMRLEMVRDFMSFLWNLGSGKDFVML